MKNTPYTYLIGWSKLGIWYYGCRYAKTCRPDEFWISYHTSSKHVREFRKEHGEPDVVQVRKTFDVGMKARSWEERVLRRMKCVKSVSWLNKSNAGKEWYPPEKELVRRSALYSGSGNPNFGKTHTPEAIAKMKENRRTKNPNGRHAMPHSEESKAVIKAKARKQAEAGGMAAHTKVCCVGCRRETNIPGFKRAHQNCSA